MPSFKSLGSKMLGGIKKRNTDIETDNDSGGNDSAVDLQSGSPEAVAARSVKAFCQSGGPGQQNGDEVTFLPPIVESAESSPVAAAECARLIRKYLKKDYWANPSYQYNALMLTRILSDNPGPTFTRNLDDKFVDTLKELLKNGRDLPVRQMLMEVLDVFEYQKGWDDGLAGCIEMWRKEKEKAYRAYGGRLPPAPMPMMGGPPPHVDQRPRDYSSRSHNSRHLPDPAELASRLEEARTSAKLLTQLVANTPSVEVIDNELVKEFADRCLSASRSIQGYMAATDPAPDNETMETFIDVNEELQQALNNQKRAVLSARKEHGVDGRSHEPSPVSAGANGMDRPPPLPPQSAAPPAPTPSSRNAFAGAPSSPRKRDNGKGKARQSQVLEDGYPSPTGPPPSRPAPASSMTGLVSPVSDDEDDEQNPFRDPEQPISASSAALPNRRNPVADHNPAPVVIEQPNPDYEPFHPGFSQPTQSYLGRQDSAMNKLQMHGASSGSPEPGPDAYGTSRDGGDAAGGSSSSYAAGGIGNEYADEDDIYSGGGGLAGGSSSSGKNPVKNGR